MIWNVDAADLIENYRRRKKYPTALAVIDMLVEYLNQSGRVREFAAYMQELEEQDEPNIPAPD